MKELSIEQKAQRYDEAIERAKELLEIGLKDTRDKRVVLSFFPELRASEDERIRGAIIDHLKDYNLTEWAAWLEKQGRTFTKKDVDDAYLKGVCNTKQELEKQGENHIVGNNEMVKPIDKVEQKSAVLIPKFHVGDKLVSTYNTSLTYEVLEVGHINKLGNPDYKVEIFTDGKAEIPRNIHYMECYKVDEWAKLIEQKPAWGEEDENKINRLIAYFEDKESFTAEDDIVYANWLKSLKDRVQPKQEWSEEDEETLDGVIDSLRRYNYNVPSKAVDEQILWLKSLKDRIQPKVECSEDDKQLIDEAAEYLRKYAEQVQGGYSKYYVFSLADRIESLKP